MKHVTLGTTGVQVSPICLGTWQIGGDWGDAALTGAIDSVSRALERGINFFDTAAVYGEGRAEAGLAKGLGDAIKTRRADLVISTKGGVELRGEGAQQEFFRNSDESFLRERLERSLRTLRTDYVDVFTIHWPDPTVPFAETAGVVRSFVDEGLVRFVALSNFDVAQTAEFARHCDVAVAQLPFNLVDRRIADDLVPYCRDNGIALIGWGALAHGVLSQPLPDHPSGFAADDWRASSPVFQQEHLQRLAPVTARLREYADDLGCTLAQLAIAWMLNAPYGVTPIMGALEPAHVDAAVDATEIALTDAQVRELEQIVEPVHPWAIGGEDLIQIRATA